MRPIEEVLPLAKRDEVRAAWLAEARWYSPWLHLAITSLSGLGAIGLAVSQLHRVTWWQVAFGLALFVASNAIEWRIHKSLLHQRFRPAAVLYDRHTPRHHVVFITDDMALRNPGEFRMVLLPAFAIAALGLGLAPAIAMIWLGWPFHLFPDEVHHELAAVFTIATMGYVLLYEWLHLAYHLPPDSRVGRLPGLALLRRHHALHHHPRLMQRWNFNVSLPLWDRVLGTYTRTSPEERPPS